MNPVRGGVAALAGVLTGALATGITAVGEWQAGLAAGGLLGTPGTSGVVVVAPAGATGVAIATAVLDVALGLATVVVLRRATGSVATRRAFWSGVIVVTATALVIGATLAQGALEPGTSAAPAAVLAAAGHSSLLAAIGLTALIALLTTRRRDPERGRLVG